MTQFDAHHSDWTATARQLPPDGERVEFRLAERVCPLRGTFRFGRFCSRWIGYVPAVVSEWRELSVAPAWLQTGEAAQSLSRARAASGGAGLAAQC